MVAIEPEAARVDGDGAALQTMTTVWDTLHSVGARDGCRTAVRLPLAFDAQRLEADLGRVEAMEGVAESQIYGYDDGTWTGIALVSADGSVDNLAYGPGEYLDTPALAGAPYVREILDRIGGRRQRVRLLVLHPGGRIYAHRDGPVCVENGVARLHIPIVTSPRVTFRIGLQRCRWRPGELWYGDFSFPHAGRNAGSQRRVHLVIDVVPDDRFRALFPSGYLDPRAMAVRSAYRELAVRVNASRQLVQHTVRRARRGGTPRPQPAPIPVPPEVADALAGEYLGDEGLPVEVTVRTRRGALVANVPGWSPLTLVPRDDRSFAIDDFLPDASVTFGDGSPATTATVFQGSKELVRLTRVTPGKR